MFNWFLKDYEANIFKANDRKLKSLYTWEKVLLALLAALSIVWFIIINLFQPGSTVSLIILSLLIGLTIIICFLENNRQKKELDKIVERFKKNKLQPFLIMLQDEKYTMFGRSLDSKEGIEWLLKACSIEIEKCKNKPSFFLPIKNSFYTLILPISTYIGGTITSTLSNTERLNFSVMVLIILLMLFGIYCIASPTLNDFLTKRIRVIEDLEDNLEYYKMIRNDLQSLLQTDVVS